MMTWIAENWVAVLMMWVVGGFVLAMFFGKAATLGRTQEEQDAEDKAQIEYLEKFMRDK